MTKYWYTLDMKSNASIWIGMTIGSLIGGAIPGLWDAGIFSISSVLLSAIGGGIGIWAGYRLSSF